MTACRNCGGVLKQTGGEWVHVSDGLRRCSLYAIPEQAIASLTPREQSALDFIRRHVEEVGFAPTLREVADEIGLGSVASVSYILDCLVKKGAIRRIPGRPRALSIVGGGA